MGSDQSTDVNEKSVDVFRERVEYRVDSTVPSHVAFDEQLARAQNRHNLFLEDRDKIILDEIRQKFRESDAKAQMDGDARYLSFSAEQVQQQEQEQEQQQEQEQEQEQEVEQEAEQVTMEEFSELQYKRTDEGVTQWSFDSLDQAPQKEKQVFFPAKEFSVFGGVMDEPARLLHFPESLYLSENYYRKEWTTNSHRRLKNVIVTMEWVPDRERITILAPPAEGAPPVDPEGEPITLSELQENRLKRAYNMLTNGTNALSREGYRNILTCADVDLTDPKEEEKVFAQMAEFADPTLRGYDRFRHMMLHHT